MDLMTYCGQFTYMREGGCGGRGDGWRGEGNEGKEGWSKEGRLNKGGRERIKEYVALLFIPEVRGEAGTDTGRRFMYILLPSLIPSNF